jgi:hypothetical protein
MDMQIESRPCKMAGHRIAHLADPNKTDAVNGGSHI